MEATTTRAALLPQTPPPLGAEVVGAQTAAYVGLLRALAPDDWARPTDCTAWDVRQVAAHVTGAFDEGAHLLVMLRHVRSAKRISPPRAMVDALNEAQVADRRGLHGPAIIEQLDRLAPRAIRSRRRAPGVIRRRPVPGNDLPPGSTFAYLYDVIFARDIWMHRVDTARATGRQLAPAEGDDVVVAQVIRDLARFWTGPTFTLELDSPTSSWEVGAGEPVAVVRADTVELLRMLSGRRVEPTLDVQGDDAVRDFLLAARVAF